MAPNPGSFLTRMLEAISPEASEATETPRKPPRRSYLEYLDVAAKAACDRHMPGGASGDD